MQRLGILFFITVGLGVIAQALSLFRDSKLRLPSSGSELRSQQTEALPVAKPVVSFQRFIDSSTIPDEQDFFKTVVNATDVNEKLTVPGKVINGLQQMAISSSIPSDFIPNHGDCTTPLAVALQYGFIDAANLLLEKGADPNVNICPMMTSPLHQAIFLQNYGMVSNLLAHGADPNRVEVNGNAVSMAVKSWKTKSEALMSAMMNGMVSKDGSLNRDKAEDVVSELETNPALSSSKDDVSLSILKLLVASGGKVTIKNHLGLEPLVSAIVANNMEAFNYILSIHPDHGYCIVSVNGTRTPIHFLLASQGDSCLPYLVALHSSGVDLFQPFDDKTITSFAEGSETKKWLNSIQGE